MLEVRRAIVANFISLSHGISNPALIAPAAALL